MDEKNALRRKIRAEIEALPEDYITRSDAGIYMNITALREFKDAAAVFLYYSVGREPDTVRIAEAAIKEGKTVTFPYCFRGGIMEARVVTSLSELTPAMLGIPAPQDSARKITPEELDFIIVPALAYDTTGYRLGYGGGYYDRFLVGLKAFKAGVARERLLQNTVPREVHDIAVDCLITESRTGRIPAKQ